jgi:uncharacterized protein
MAGEKDLGRMLASMTPELQPGTYVFCALPDLGSVDIGAVLFVFKEVEAVTVVVPQQYADAQGWTYSYRAAWITLQVHSALEAVGLTAAFSQALAQNGISCNVVAAVYHDHIFVAEEDATWAMRVLQALSAAHR